METTKSKPYMEGIFAVVGLIIALTDISSLLTIFLYGIEYDDPFIEDGIQGLLRTYVYRSYPIPI
jgi:hypothetical protein